MKKLFLIIGILTMTLAMAGAASADLFLAVDKPTDITPTTTQINVNGVVTDGICIFGTDVIGDYIKILDVTAFGQGNYIFRARWHDGSGFWSDWSGPFDAARSGQAGNARIVEE